MAASHVNAAASAIPPITSGVSSVFGIGGTSPASLPDGGPRGNAIPGLKAGLVLHRRESGPGSPSGRVRRPTFSISSRSLPTNPAPRPASSAVLPRGLGALIPGRVPKPRTTKGLRLPRIRRRSQVWRLLRARESLPAPVTYTERFGPHQIAPCRLPGTPRARAQGPAKGRERPGDSSLLRPPTHSSPRQPTPPRPRPGRRRSRRQGRCASAHAARARPPRRMAAQPKPARGLAPGDPS
jgi:hypothetical protein